MNSRFIVHRHKTRRSHFDLRLVENDRLRCWSLLKEPPGRGGEQRLAIERESFRSEEINKLTFNEAAFGEGKVSTWDEGEVRIAAISPRQLVLVFKGKRLSGRYELDRMLWYPGNRWLFKKAVDAKRPKRDLA